MAETHEPTSDDVAQAQMDRTMEYLRAFQEAAAGGGTPKGVINNDAQQVSPRKAVMREQPLGVRAKAGL